MDNDLMGLLAVRRGHFAFESGHHGSVWLDLDGLFLRPARLRPHVLPLAERLAAYRPDAVCGPQTGGALLALMIADLLDLEFVPAERRLDPSSGTVSYQIPVTLRLRIAEQRVVLVDDAVNAASALRATHHDLVTAGGTPVALGALISQTQARDATRPLLLPLHSIVELPSDLWAPDACPLCRGQVPLNAQT